MKEKINKANVCLYIPSFLLIILLSFIDKEFLINHIFAGIFLALTFIFFGKEGLRKQVYLIILLTAAMGAALRIPLKSEILSQINVYYIFIFVYLLMLGIDLLRKKEKFDIKSLLKRPLLIIGVIFAIYVFISFFWSGNKIFAIKELVNYIVIFSLFLIVIIENRTKEDRKITRRFLCIVALGILVYGTFKIVTGIVIEPRTMYKDYEYFSEPAYEYVKRIPTVFYYNPNEYAVIVCMIMIGLLIGITKTTKRNCKVLWIFIFFVAQVNIIFSSCRTAWVTLMLSMVLLGIIYIFKRNKKSLIRTILMFVLVIGTFGAFYINPLTEIYFGKIKKVETIGNYKYTNDRLLVKLNTDTTAEVEENKGLGLFNQESDNTRINLIKNSFDYVFKGKNYLGAGVGNINEYNISVGNTKEISDSHCLWAEILGDFGIVGLALFLIVYVGYFIKNLKGRKTGKQDFNLIMLFAIALLVFAPSSVVGLAPIWIMMSFIFASIEFEN